MIEEDKKWPENPTGPVVGPSKGSTTSGKMPGMASEAETGSCCSFEERCERVGEAPLSSVECQKPPQSDRFTTNTPNIPNVIEYHLKVKSQSPTQTRVEMKKDNEGSPQRDHNRNVLLSPEDSAGELPQEFQAKYLGCQDARGLWGIKHTRKPVDNMVAKAKALPAEGVLPLVKIIVSKDGLRFSPLAKSSLNSSNDIKCLRQTFAIEDISYGVQDLVYTRVFSMIVVRDTDDFRRTTPFECHGFVCESKHQARQLTYALAEAFRVYSEKVKDKKEESCAKKKYAIDLRQSENVGIDIVYDS